MSRVWLLNLEAETELAQPRTPHDPTRIARERPELIARLGELVPRGDDVLTQAAGPSLAGKRCMVWSATTSARAVLEARGADLSHLPSAAVVARVSSRAFAAEQLGLLLPGAQLVHSQEAADRALAAGSISGKLLLRKMFGFAGRGRRIAQAGALSESDLNFARKAVNEGGLLIEPYVERTSDVSLHGFCDERGVVVGEPTVATLNDGGVWQASSRDPSMRSDYVSALREQLLRAADALLAAGYRGPLGIDGFTYVASRDQAQIQPQICARCEVNARYSMAWAIGMAGQRPDLA